MWQSFLKVLFFSHYCQVALLRLEGRRGKAASTKGSGFAIREEGEEEHTWVGRGALGECAACELVLLIVSAG